MGWQWHQLHHVQITCTLLQTDPHQYLITQFFTGQMLFLMQNHVKAIKAENTHNSDNI